MDSKRHILVTGGAGYIGSHTCKALAKAGYSPVVYDNLVYGHEWAVKWGSLEKGDIVDRARLVGDSRKISKELGWEPRYNDLETIIETAWKWTSK